MRSPRVDPRRNLACTPSNDCSVSARARSAASMAARTWRTVLKIDVKSLITRIPRSPILGSRTAVEMPRYAGTSILSERFRAPLASSVPRHAARILHCRDRVRVRAAPAAILRDDCAAKLPAGDVHRTYVAEASPPATRREVRCERLFNSRRNSRSDRRHHLLSADPDCNRASHARSSRNSCV
jgi:hypothetical protein